MPGRSSSPRERDAEIDRDPLPPALVAKPVEREIHADLADPAERRKDEFVAVACHQAAPAPRLPPGPRVPRRRRRRSPPAAPRSAAGPGGRRRRSSRNARRSRGRRGARGSRPPRPAARASQSARMVEKCSPRFHCASRPSILTESAANSASGETSAPAAARSVAGKSVSAGWLAQLTPMPTATAPVSSPPSPSIRMPANFAAVEQEIVRPFDRKLRLEPGRNLRDRVMDRERGHEGEFRPVLGRRRIGQQQASQTDCRPRRSRCGRAARGPRSAARR